MKSEDYILSGVLDLYVAGILPSKEMKEISFIVSQDPILQAEVKEIEAALLAYSQSQAMLSKNLLPAIKEKIHQADKEQAIQVSDAEKEKPDIPSAKKILHKKHIRYRGIRYATAILSVFLLVSLVMNYQLYNQWFRTQKDLSQVHQSIETMTARLQAVSAKAASAHQYLDSFMHPGTEAIALKATAGHSGMKGTVMYNTQTGNTYMIILYLPLPPANRQYQLWAIDKDGQPVNAGVLPVNFTKGKILPMNNMTNAKSFAVTLEPMGGSWQPSLDKMIMKSE